MNFGKRDRPSAMDRTRASAMERRKPAPEPVDDVDAEDGEKSEVMPARLAAFIERNKAEAARFKDATDTECWVAVCFQNRADKDAFIAEFGLADHGQIPGVVGNKYVNGYDWARALRDKLK